MLESSDFLISERVCFGNDWNEVDLGVESAHDFDVKRLERMSSRLDKVYTRVHTIVDNVHAVDLVFCVKIRIKPLLNVLDDWSPGIIVVNKVTKTRRVYNGQS